MSPRRIALCCALTLSAWGATEASEWTTLQHDAARSGYSPVRVSPPYREKWCWMNGERFDPGVDTAPEFARTWMTRRMQPVTDGRLVFVGSVSDGHLYSIDLETGRTRWKYDASAPIAAAATVWKGAVYFGDVKGGLHCVDAATGERRWVFEDPHRGSFQSCPAVVGGLVLIGSRSGHFFALEAESGHLWWEFDAENPILNSPAVHGDGVYFGDEGMYARRLELWTGGEVWKRRLHGWTLRHHGPVVVPKRNAVIWRSSPILDEGAGKIVDDALTLDPKRGKTSGGDNAARKYAEELKKAKEKEGEFRAAQLAARQCLKERPEARTFFVLDMETGEEPFVAPAGYASQHADVCPPPVAFPHGYVLSYYRGRWGALKGVVFSSRYMIDIGYLNFESGLFQRLAAFNSIEAPFGIRGDDNARLSVGGNILYGNWGSGGGNRERATGALDLRALESHTLGNVGWNGKSPVEKAISAMRARAGRTGNSCCAVVIASNGTLLVNRLGVAIVAVEGKTE